MALMRYTATITVSHVIDVADGSFAADHDNLDAVLGNLADAYENLVRSNDLLAPDGPLGFAVDGYEVSATATRALVDAPDATGTEFAIGDEVLVREGARTADGGPVYFDGEVLATVVLPADRDGDLLVQQHEGIQQYVHASFVEAV